jgi:hypothetical protein
MKKDRGGNVKERYTDIEKNGENSRLKKHSTSTHTQIHDVQNVQLFQTNNSNSATFMTNTNVFTIEVVVFD